MANPLATIRKYDKYLLAVFGVLLMIAFLIDDSLMSLVSGPSYRGGAVPGRAVSFKGGSLSEAQLNVMHVAENAALEVMRQVFTETQAKQKMPREFPTLLPSGSEYELVHKMLLAEKAHQLGLSLSDADIDRLLKQFSDETLTDADLKRIRNEVLSDYRSSRISISEKDIYAQLRTNFLAQEMLALLRNNTKIPQGGEGEVFDLMSQQTPRMKVTPAQAWDYFRRMNRKVRVEVLPLEVEKFVDQVKGEPTAAQKDELFEKYKNAVPNPASAEPGFASPHKIAFGYVRVDFGKYLEEEKAKITEEQLKAEYEKRVEAGEFRVPVLPEDKKDEAEKPEAEEPKTEDKPAEDKPAEDKPAEDKPAEDKPAEDKPAEDKPAEDKPEDAAKPEEPKAEENAVEEKSEGESSAAEDELTDDSSLEPEAQADEATEEAKPEASADEQPAASEEKPEATATEEPAKTESEESAAEEAKPEGEKPADEEKKAEPKKPETRVRTFEEVKDDLRAQLARKPAQDRQEAAIKEVEQIIRKYGAEYRAWDFEQKQADQKKKKSAQQPEKPELAPRLSEVVKKHSLSFKQLDLLDRYEIAQDELGATSFFTGRGFAPFSQVYDFNMGLFEPAQVGGDLRDVTYLFWKEQDQEAKPAERKDAEAQIVRAWKMGKAYELALAEAKELVSKARDKESLRAAFPEGVDKAGAIQETSPFSWLTTGAMPFGMAAPEISRIPEVPYAGEEFMQTVMDLKPGEVEAAPDQPHKTVYVVRVISETPEEKALREMFLSQGIVNPNIAFQYASDRSEQLQTWMSNLEKDLQLTWHRPPQPFQR